ncbi:Protein of unknown function DUF2320 [Sphingobium chlorophenolicum L-1]|uniref:Outer membrane beta-barrel protein n=1 Tax=Sphingobium chlorophenolicum L-1 TaxID=690566 RepID=F6EWQ5_SPHCR|nr:outer membrane beta-barrel protein [Sphingobium chlorophenolicum]AEG49843.1 Protein of unknown function DUF2320 [Sphingobium chlorophenolicum L-1]
MRRSVFGPASGGATALLLIAASPNAHAQDLDPATSLQGEPAALFEPTPLRLGSATVRIGGSARLEYDSNIYAQAFGEKDDFRLQVRPYVDLLRKGDALELTARAEGDFRKYFQYDKEDAEGGRVSAGLNWNPSAADRLTVAAGWQHLIEDRGEPEGNTLPSIGPRELNLVDGDLSYLHQGSRIGFLVKATGARMRYTRAIDEERDLDAVGGLARVMLRVSPLMSAFVEGVAAHRNFRLAPAPGQFNRDASTYGARIGIAIDPGGTLRGDAAVGVYRLDAKDKLIESQTRMSVQIALTYAPRPRTAISLEGFVGNVATYRTGVQSREDMRFRLGINQEIRHNLSAQLGILYRRSKYFGVDDIDHLYGVTGELEYAVNRRVAIAATARFSKRDSSVALDEFDRFRGGLELRVHY